MTFVAQVSCKNSTMGQLNLCITSPDMIGWAVRHVAKIYDDADFEEYFEGASLITIEIKMVEMSDEEFSALPEYNSADY